MGTLSSFNVDSRRGVNTVLWFPCLANLNEMLCEVGIKAFTIIIGRTISWSENGDLFTTKLVGTRQETLFDHYLLLTGIIVGHETNLK